MSWGRMLLIFSLSLNFFFVLGYVYVQGTVKKLESSRGRMELALDSLNPTHSQHAALEQDIEEWSKKMRVDNEKHSAEVNQYWAVVQNPDVPVQTLNESNERICKLETNRLLVSMDFLRKVMMELNPQQRKKLAEMIHDANKF